MAAAEAHGKRLDAAGKARAILDQPALTNSGLDLADLYAAHVRDAKVQKSATTALHLILQFPTELVDGENADDMLKHARAFAASVFGDEAIFADRVDRDEKSRHVVDLFLAPRYQKKTKRRTQTAISTSKHLKELAAAHGKAPTLRGQGQALQDAWFEYLRDEMRLRHVQRGEAKKRPGDDWKTPEELDLQARLADVEAREKAVSEREEALKGGMLKRLTKRDPPAAEQVEAAHKRSEAAQRAKSAADALRLREVKEARLWASEALQEHFEIAENMARDARYRQADASRAIDEAEKLRRKQIQLSQKIRDQSAEIERLEVQNRDANQQVEELSAENQTLSKTLKAFQGFHDLLNDILRSEFGSRWEAFRTQINTAWSRDGRNPEAQSRKTYRSSGPSGP